MRSVAAVALLGAAFASDMAYYLSEVPALPTFRERVAIDLVFAAVLPMALLIAAAWTYVDPPSGSKRPRRAAQAFNLGVSVPLLTAAGLIWVLAIINGLMLALSFVAGESVSPPWA